jgi:hypothetical protein
MNGDSIELFRLNLMIMTVRDLIISFCRKLGFYPSRLISTEKLRQLRGFLRPVDNGVELIRIGPLGDGGYLLPNDFDKSEICFSPGVSNLWGFEKDLYEKFGISSLMYDASVSAPINLPANHRFIKKYVGASTFGNFISISDILSTELKNYHNIIGQIDIEGFEYDLFKSISVTDLSKFRMIVCEFHHCELWIQNRNFIEIILPMFTKIFSDFDLVHYHVNNAGGTFKFKGQVLPRIVELTFHRKDRARVYKGYRVVPNLLDIDNIDRYK